MLENENGVAFREIFLYDVLGSQCNATRSVLSSATNYDGHIISIRQN